MTVARRIHVLGIGGPGMSALARVLHEMGHAVSGCDVRSNVSTETLANDGVAVHVGNSPDHLTGVEILTRSSAIRSDHPEVIAAGSIGARVQTRAETLAMVCESRRSVGVAGTHGKTTTTAMLATILRRSDRDPSYLIGGDTHLPGSNAHWGGGEIFVVEADESDSTHLALPLQAAIVTNVDVDHLDNFGDFAEVFRSFERFVGGVNGPVLVCADDEHASRLCGLPNVVGFGIDAGEYRAEDVSMAPGRVEFTVVHGSKRHSVTVEQRGVHNVRNALAALAMADRLGVDLADACEALREFRGVARRFDVRGTINGVTLVDDYAHLPAEIEATLAAARQEHRDGRLFAVFQPNRFNRMDKMSGDYRDAFGKADVTVITEIYSSGTAPIAGVSGSLVVDAVRHAHPRSEVHWCPTREDLVAFLIGRLRSGDMCLSMGCGDIENLPSELATRWASS